MISKLSHICFNHLVYFRLTRRTYIEQWSNNPQSQQPSQTTPTSSTSSRNENLMKSPKSFKRKLTPNLPPLRPSKTINKRKKSNWTDDETRMFLHVYAKWEKKLRTESKKKTVWLAIYKQYQLVCKQYNVQTSRNII